MIDRLILGVALGTAGINGLLPPEPVVHVPLTSAQLQAKAKIRSVSEMCGRKNKKSTQARQICKRWEELHA